jgi:hypothetical protein
MSRSTYVKRFQAQLSFKGTLRARLIQRLRAAVASLAPSRYKAAEIHPHASPTILEAVPLAAAALLAGVIVVARRARRRFH